MNMLIIAGWLLGCADPGTPTKKGQQEQRHPDTIAVSYKKTSFQLW
jgi:hypothetical protein